GAEADAPRRDHERARPAARRRGAEPRPRARRLGHDDDHRDARDELLPRGRRHGVLPRRGRHRRAGAARTDLYRPARAADTRVPRANHRSRANVRTLFRRLFRVDSRGALAMACLLSVPLYLATLLAASLALDKP